MYTCFVHPSPFTPDGDGINDYAKFEYPGMGDEHGKVFIYNLDNEFVREIKTGDIVRDNTGIIYWDGRDREGNLVECGVYIYVVEGKDKILCKGTIL